MLLSEVEFSSLYSYCPRGEAKECQQSKNRVLELKQDRFVGASPRAASSLVAERLREVVDHGILVGFGSEAVLVPTPGHGIIVKGGLWVPHRICNAIVAAGLARSVSPCLSRKRAVPKASYVDSGRRPKALDHYGSTPRWFFIARASPATQPSHATDVPLPFSSCPG